MTTRVKSATKAKNVKEAGGIGEDASKERKRKKLTDEEFIQKWIGSWRQGHNLTDFAADAKIKYHEAVNRHRALMRIEVDLPPLRGQQGVRPSTWNRTSRLKELVAKLLAQ